MYEIFEKKEEFFGNVFDEEANSVFSTISEDVYKNSIEKYNKEKNISDELIMHFMTSVWDDTLIIGIDNIDNQHKEMFNLIRELLNSMKENNNVEEIILKLDKLGIYSRKHFKEEEAIQKQYKYPKYKIQIMEHKKFERGLSEMRIILKHGNISPLFTIIMYQKIFNYYRKHMLYLDKNFGEFLLNKIR